MADVVALGEVLIDFTPFGYSENKTPLFEQNPGGAPANVLSAVTRLGGSAAFIGKAGNDFFGRFLKDTLERNHIDCSSFCFSERTPTTMAFVELDKEGNRNFTFIRNPGADTELSPANIGYDLIQNAKIFHFGSLSLTDEPACSATLHALSYAKTCEKIISYDPNYRPLLWRNQETAVKKMQAVLPFVDLLKVSQEELVLLSGTNDLEKGCSQFLDDGCQIVFVTLGKNGCYVQNPVSSMRLATYDTRVIDTTGSGDAFWGAVLYQICNQPISPANLSSDALYKIADFANAAGALCATRRGAIPAMPTLFDVLACIQNIPKLEPQE